MLTRIVIGVVFTVLLAGVGVSGIGIYKTYPRQVQAAPNSNKKVEAPKEPQKRYVPFYGTAFRQGLVTSIYFYPSGPDEYTPGAAQTHIKFDMDDDHSVWICGDVRNKFTSGRRYRILFSEEPEGDCVSNWHTR